MRMYLSRAFNLSVVTFVICALSCFAAVSDSDLKDKRISIKMEDQPFGAVIENLMTSYDIQFGFEESTLDRGVTDFQFTTNPAIAEVSSVSDDGKSVLNVEITRVFTARKYPITLDFDNAKLGDVLDRLVDQMVNYDWEISEGVVNIFPRVGRDKRFEELLNTKIPLFSIEKEKTIRDLSRRLAALTPFRDWLRRNDLNFSGVRRGTSFLVEAEYGRKLENPMSFSNMTFRSLLNNIVRTKKGGWALRWKFRNSKDEEHIDIDI